MATAPVPAPLKGFRRLSPSTYIYEPARTTSSDNNNKSDPEIILIPSWLDAQPKHIAKYTTYYQSTYPNARILLITTNLPDITYRSWSSIIADRRPSFEIIRDLPSGTRILGHVFSNGGSLSLAGLAKRYREVKGRPLKIDGLVFDSTPGRNRYGPSVAALSAGLPKTWFVSLFAGVLIRLYLGIAFLIARLGRSGDRIDRMRDELNDGELFEVGTKRLYVYGEADRMIMASDVRDHAVEAEAKGWSVSQEVFVGTPHVGHMMGDPKRYWAAVKTLWDICV